MMLMGFPADIAVEEKARDAKVVLEVAARGKRKALAERVAAAKTVGTRRERASISHDEENAGTKLGVGREVGLHLAWSEVACWRIFLKIRW